MVSTGVRSAPYTHGGASVRRVMREVLLALVPGIAVTMALLGPGVIVQALVAVTTALAVEGLCERLRGQAAGLPGRDLSVVVGAILFALALPPTAPWYVNVLGIVVGVGFAKHAFGGLGSNLFNPAMAGYGFVILAFPTALAEWPSTWDVGAVLGVSEVDGVTQATPLASVKTDIRLMLTLAELRGGPDFGWLGAARWEWLNLAFLAGGLYLLSRRVIRWQIPVGVLAGLALASLAGFTVDGDRYPSPLFHLFSGATMIGAFFIATEPVTSPSHGRGRLAFGFGVGVMIYLIRTFGAYPDGVAFAVLSMNSLTPLIERFLRPPVVGERLVRDQERAG